MPTYDPKRLLATAKALDAGMPDEWADGDRAMIQHALRTTAASEFWQDAAREADAKYLKLYDALAIIAGGDGDAVEIARQMVDPSDYGKMRTANDMAKDT